MILNGVFLPNLLASNTASPSQKPPANEEEDTFHSPQQQDNRLGVDPLMEQALNAARLQKATEYLTAERASIMLEGGEARWYEDHLTNLQAFVDDNTDELDKLLASDASINQNDMTDEEENVRKRRIFS